MVRYLLLALMILVATPRGGSGERTVWDEEDEAREAALIDLPEGEEGESQGPEDRAPREAEED